MLFLPRHRLLAELFSVAMIVLRLLETPEISQFSNAIAIEVDPRSHHRSAGPPEARFVAALRSC